MQLIYYGDSLKHHGVIGQRWGIRRYQPYPDGSKKGKEIGKAAKKDSRFKKARSMSDSDLSNAIDRLQKEKKYLELSGESVSQGKAFAQNILIGVGTMAITTFATTMAVKGGQAATAAILKKTLPGSVFNAIYKKK